MNRQRWYVWAGIVGIALAAVGPAWAAPLRTEDIPAEATWWAHIILDRFWPTELGQAVLEMSRTDEAQRKLAAFKAVFGFDLIADVHSLAAGGARPRGAVILLGRFDAERLVTLIRAAQGYEERRIDGYKIHSWIDEQKARKEGPEKARMFGAHHPSGALILSEQPTAVAKVLAVMDGSSPATKWIPPPEAANAVLIAVLGEGTIHDAKNPALAALRTATLTVTESEGRLVAQLRAMFASADPAEKIGQILTGLRALALLNAEKDPRGAALAAGSDIQTEGETLTVQIALPVSDLIREIQKKASSRATSSNP